MAPVAEGMSFGKVVGAQFAGLTDADIVRGGLQPTHNIRTKGGGNVGDNKAEFQSSFRYGCHRCFYGG